MPSQHPHEPPLRVVVAGEHACRKLLGELLVPEAAQLRTPAYDPLRHTVRVGKSGDLVAPDHESRP